MVTLFEQDSQTIDRQSSKGNQLKWRNGENWYKADYLGYEGLAEYVVSHLLDKSSLSRDQFVSYELTQIRYKQNVFNGVKSCNFLTDDWQIITLERLFKKRYGVSFHKAIWEIGDTEKRFSFLCSQVRNMTGLADFDRYMNALFTIDAFFLNEDRHFHNIAVLMNGRGEFAYCPIFDNGACLLSDTRLEYPLSGKTYDLMKKCRAKTIHTDFEEQLDVSEKMTGYHLKFSFTKKDIEKIVADASFYSEETKERVWTILYEQMRKYNYLFA